MDIRTPPREDDDEVRRHPDPFFILRAGLDFACGYAEGQALTLDGAVALALPPAESALAALYPEPRPQLGYTIVRSMMRRSSGR